MAWWDPRDWDWGKASNPLTWFDWLVPDAVSDFFQGFGKAIRNVVYIAIFLVGLWIFIKVYFWIKRARNG